MSRFDKIAEEVKSLSEQGPPFRHIGKWGDALANMYDSKSTKWGNTLRVMLNLLGVEIRRRAVDFEDKDTIDALGEKIIDLSLDVPLDTPFRR